jgi:ribosomal protein L37E
MLRNVLQGYEGWKDEERSPVFHQFLDCVYQCINQLPRAFEFTEDLLLFILEHTQSGWFGDFMFNCEKEKREFKRSFGGVSLWATVLHNTHRFLNGTYEAQAGAILPVARLGRLLLWSKWFNRWNDRLWRAAWIQQCHVEEPLLDDSAHLSSNYAGGVAGAGPNTLGAARMWVDDSAVTACRRCAKPFSFINRRHHCRRCGYIFCEKCAAESRTIVSISAYRPVRVCVDCAHIIDQGIESESIISQYEASLRSQHKGPGSGPDGHTHTGSSSGPSPHAGINSETSFGVTFQYVGERSTEKGLVDEWNGEY